MLSLTTRELFLKYRAIFISVMLFLVIDSSILISNIYNSVKIAESAVSINLGGRQRMLSQRTTKVLLSLQDDIRRGVPQDADLKELALVVDLFDTTLKGFRDGGTVTGGDGRPTHLVQVETDKAHQLVRDAYEIWTPYLVKLQPLLKGTGFSQEELEDATTYARANNLKLLGLMNDLTSDLERTADRRATILRWFQIVGLTFVILNVLYTVIISIRDLMRGDRDLAKARKETEEILGTVKEGLFLLDREYRLGSQYSKSLGEVLRRDVSPEMPFLPVLEEMVSKDVFDSAKDYIELLFGDRVKEALIVSLNPLSQVEVRSREGEKSRYLSFNFNRVLEEGKIAHLLVTVQDVTELVHLTTLLEAAKGQSRVEVEVLLRLLNTDASVLRQFLDNVGKGLAQINERLRSEDDSEQARLHLLNYIMRIVHGIKGEAAALNIDMFEGYAHAFETELVGMREKGEVRGEDMVRITVLLDGFYERLASITNIAEKMSGAGSGADADEKYLQAFIGGMQNLVARIAGDERKEVAIASDVEAIARLPRRIANELNGIAIQLLRNAVKHGIEMPDEREAQGKPASGEIRVECKETGHDEYEFAVRDDGRGISVSRIREALVQKGLFTKEEADALSVEAVMLQLFEPGFSTAAEADRDAGRGVGLDVVAEEIMKLRGHLTLNSKAQAFTEFRIRFSL
ncbi:MAG: ATP-binding protein [Proteobacteria bacterium]|nr:ATP-binding protein [Pseudomonadota bacterium]